MAKVSSKSVSQPRSKPAVAKPVVAKPVVAKTAAKKAPAARKAFPEAAGKAIAKPRAAAPAKKSPAHTVPAAGKWVFTFGDGRAEGKSAMRELLGGKGANLAEMANLGLPVPPGFTIPT